MIVSFPRCDFIAPREYVYDPDFEEFVVTVGLTNIDSGDYPEIGEWCIASNDDEEFRFDGEVVEVLYAREVAGEAIGTFRAQTEDAIMERATYHA